MLKLTANGIPDFDQTIEFPSRCKQARIWREIQEMYFCRSGTFPYTFPLMLSPMGLPLTGIANNDIKFPTNFPHLKRCPSNEQSNPFLIP